MFWFHMCEEFCPINCIYLLLCDTAKMLFCWNLSPSTSGLQPKQWLTSLNLLQFCSLSHSTPYLLLVETLTRSRGFSSSLCPLFTLHCIPQEKCCLSFFAHFQIPLRVDLLKLCADMTGQASDSHRAILLSQTLLLDLQALGQVALNKQSSSLSEFTGTSPQCCIQRQFDFLPVRCHIAVNLMMGGCTV